MLGTVFQVDTSPWGGGAILKNNGVAIAYGWAVWDTASVAHPNVRTGIPDHQTSWEALALLISMITWRRHFAQC